MLKKETLRCGFACGSKAGPKLEMIKNKGCTLFLRLANPPDAPDNCPNDEDCTSMICFGALYPRARKRSCPNLPILARIVPLHQSYIPLGVASLELFPSVHGAAGESDEAQGRVWPTCAFVLKWTPGQLEPWL